MQGKITLISPFLMPQATTPAIWYDAMKEKFIHVGNVGLCSYNTIYACAYEFSTRSGISKNKKSIGS